MDPRLLHQLATIIELGSLSRAAQRLNVTQPTLTRNVRIIEDRIGAPVLRRGRYGVTPTEIGERLAEKGRAVGNLMSAADTAVDLWKSGLSGELRIGVGPMLAVSAMPSFFEEAVQQAWPYSMRITTAPAGRLVDRLNRLELDAALAPSQLNLHQERLHQEIVLKDRMAVFAGARSPLARKNGEISRSQLERARWTTTGDSSGIFGTTRDVLEALGLPVTSAKLTFTGDVGMALHLLRTTDILIVLPERLALLLPNLNGATKLDLDITPPNRHIALWVTKANRDRPEINHFAGRIRAHFHRLEEALSGGESAFRTTGNPDR